MKFAKFYGNKKRLTGLLTLHGLCIIGNSCMFPDSLLRKRGSTNFPLPRAAFVESPQEKNYVVDSEIRLQAGIEITIRYLVHLRFHNYLLRTIHKFCVSPVTTDGDIKGFFLLANHPKTSQLTWHWPCHSTSCVKLSATKLRHMADRKYRPTIS